VVKPRDCWRWRDSWRESKEEEEKNEDEEESFGRSIMTLKGATERATEGGALPSTVAWPSCHVHTLEHHQCWRLPTHLRHQPPCHPTDESRYEIHFFKISFIKKVFHKD
jgi:hypothetical protein